MKPELNHSQHPSPKSNGRFASISPLFLHLNQFVIQQVERRDRDQMEREDQYHVRQIENQRNSGGRHYSLVTVNKEGETRGDIQLSVHCNVLGFFVFYLKRNSLIRFVEPSRRLSPLRTPKSCFAKGGETAKFKGYVQGIPAPAVSWLKVGDPLE